MSDTPRVQVRRPVGDRDITNGGYGGHLVATTIGYNADGDALFIPENRLRDLLPAQQAVPLRGHGHTMAVLEEDGRCIGWILSEDLGYPTVRAWMDAHP